MSATINWTIDWMETSTQTINNFTEVVLTCGWRCVGTNTDNNKNYITSICGNCTFPKPVAGDSFTPYAQLTESQVISWCWENGVNKITIENAVNANLEAQINPAFIQPPLPWVKTQV